MFGVQNIKNLSRGEVIFGSVVMIEIWVENILFSFGHESSGSKVVKRLSGFKF